MIKMNYLKVIIENLLKINICHIFHVGIVCLVKRFSFADAAAQEYYRQFIERVTINEFIII